MTLFSLCLDFITSNINDVESLTDFPQLVGLQLFKESVRKGQFLNARKNITATNALKIFFDAFGDTGILDALDACTCHLFVNDIFGDCPWLMSHLTCLNLSSCKLGDDHELLPLVMSLNRLDTLSLSDNCLSDQGIRKATLRLRFHNQINKVLKNLDLSSNNDITPRGLVYLKPFENLCVVRVSGIPFTSMSKPDLQGRFSSRRVCQCVDSIFKFESSGWASEVIEIWKKEYDVNVNPNSQQPSSSSVSVTSRTIPSQSFYSKGSRVLQPPKDSTSRVSLSDNILTMLTTSLFHCDHVPSSNIVCVNRSNSQEKQSISPHNHNHSNADNLIVSGPFNGQCAARVTKRGVSVLENDVCMEEKNLRKVSRTSVTKPMCGENMSSGGGSLLDMYSVDESQKVKQSMGCCLRELNDWK